MPRAIWKGVISFGLVAIPVRLYLATEGKGVSFRLLCPEHKTPIKNKRWCPTGEHEIGWSDVLRGYEYEKDHFVVISDEDLQNLPLPTSRTIDIAGFIEDQQLPGALYYQTPYYLEPDPTAAKPYALLRQTLEGTGRIAVAKVALRDREHLASLRAHDGVLLMNTLYWPDEIRSAGELDVPSDVKVSPKELAMAKSLVETMAMDFDPSQFADEYREALLRVVEAKRDGEAIVAVEPAPEATVVDLMEALRASVEAAKKKQPAAKPERRARKRAVS